MTGPGRSPSSPWVQTVQGYQHDGKANQSFHPSLSPSHTGLQTSTSLSERPSPNYFGIPVENSSNSPMTNPGSHAQRNWASLSRTQNSLPSPKLHLYSQESVSEGLENLLRSESASDKGRRESAFQSRTPNGETGNNGYTGSITGKKFGSSQGKFTQFSRGSPTSTMLSPLQKETIRNHPIGFLLNAAQIWSSLRYKQFYSWMFVHLPITARGTSRAHSIFVSPRLFSSVVLSALKNSKAPSRMTMISIVLPGGKNVPQSWSMTLLPLTSRMSLLCGMS